MRHLVRAFALPLLGLLCGCPSLTDAVSPGSSKQTYPAIWINASWSGGRTGTPLESKAVTPNNIVGSYCPAGSIVPLNHYAPYAGGIVNEGLFVDSNCTALIGEMAACVSAGSGGVAPAALKTCGVDPRKTSPSQLLIYPVPPLAKRTVFYGGTGVALDVNLFYCATGSHLNLGQVAGKDPTECVVN